VDRELSKSLLLLIVELLTGSRAEIVQRQVSATPIVERLDVEEHVGLRIAGRLIHGLLNRSALTAACSRTVAIALVTTSTIPNAAIGDLTTATEQMLGFITTLLPYIATGRSWMLLQSITK